MLIHLREINMKNKVHFSSLVIIVVLLVLIPAGLGGFTEVAPEAHAQRSSSCDRAIVSLVDCPRSSDGSSTADDDDEKNNKDDNGDKGNNKDKDQKEDKNDGDIESKIPSTAGGGVPFP